MNDSPVPSAPNPEQMRHRLVNAFTDFELSFRRRFPLIWIGTLLAPVVLSVIVLTLVGVFVGIEHVNRLLVAAFLTFFVFGRFIILGGTEGEMKEVFEFLTPGELCAMVTYMDFITALFVTFHMSFLFRLPFVGHKLAALVWDGKFLLERQPWIRRVSFLGLIVFVSFPTSTTGSIGGSIFGRLLGLSRLATVTGIVCGSLVGNAIMYFFSRQINRYIDAENLWLKVAGLILLVALGFSFELRYRYVQRRYLREMGITPVGEQVDGKSDAGP